MLNWRGRKGNEARHLPIAIVADSAFASMRDSLRADLGGGTPQTAVFVLAYHRCDEDAVAAVASGSLDSVIADLDLTNVRCIDRSEVPRKAISVVNGRAERRREH